MTTALTPTPKQQFIDANGAPIASGKVWTYVSGTTTPLATYTDSGGGTPNANPVILDTAGRAEIWLTPGSAYTFAVTDANDVAVYTVDGITAVSSDSATFNDITIAGNETFTGTGRRIKGDFSNATAANRVLFQTSTASGDTELGAIPAVGGTVSGFTVYGDPAATNGAYQRMSASNSTALLQVSKQGSGSYVPWALNVGGTDQITVSTTGVITFANPCAFSVNRAGSAFTVAHDTITQVNWTTEAFDTGGYFDLTTDRFTPPAGYYQLSGVCTSTNTTDGAVCSLIYKNGAALANGARVCANSYATLIASSISCTVYANGTDYFDFRVIQVNGSSSTESFEGDSVQLYFCGHKVG